MMLNKTVQTISEKYDAQLTSLDSLLNDTRRQTNSQVTSIGDRIARSENKIEQLRKGTCFLYK